MNNTPTFSIVIQNKVFGLQGELIRWSQLKSCRSKSAATRFLTDSVLPLRQNDHYRIAVSRKSRAGDNSVQFFSIEDWFAPQVRSTARTGRDDA